MKLEAIGPEEKDKEFDVLHLEHTLQRHRDQKGRGTDPSVNTWISDGGREDSPLEAIWSQNVLLPEQSGMKGETLKWVVDHGEIGGTCSKTRVGMGVVVWLKNRMIYRRVSSIVDRERF